MRERRLCLGAAAVCALLVFGCSPSAPQAPPPAAPQPRSVEVYRVRPRPYTDRAAEFGTLAPSETLTLSAEVTAPVVEMGFAQGEEVTPGQLLYRLDERDHRLRLDSQEAALREARVTLAKARHDLERAQTLLDRGVATQQSHDDARFAVDAAEARIATLEAERAVTLRNLEKTRILSPGAYKALTAHARVGSLAAPGQPMVTLASVDPLDLVLGLPSQRAHLVRAGDRLPVHVEGLGEPVTGRVDDLTFPIPPNQGFVTVRVRVPNPRRALHPGQSARVELVVEERDDLIWVPAEAALQRFGGWGVFRVDDGIARFRGIQRGRVSGTFLEAVEGISLGDQVVVVGQAELAPGDPVAIRAER